MILIPEKIQYLSFYRQLVIGLHQRFCAHNWCEHFHIICTDNIGGHFGFIQEYCPKCGKIK